MRNTWLYPALVGLMFLGAGCWSKPVTQTNPNPQPVANALPALSVLEPGLSSSTYRETIDVKVSTDQKTVWIDGKRVEVSADQGLLTVALKPGLNNIPVAVSNGTATTTITLNVTRNSPETATTSTAETTKTAAATQPATNPVAKPSTSPTKTAPTKTTTVAPTSAPKPAPLKVEFVSGELGLTASLEPNGATLSWTKAMEPFQTYVIVKSTTDPAPYFPKIFWVKAINDVDIRTWRDTTAEAHKTTYYRVCKIKPDQSVTCGNVAKIVKP